MTTFIIICIGVLVFYLLTKNIDNTSPVIARAAENEDRQVEYKSGEVEKNIIKALAEQDVPEFVFVINAFLKNHRRIAMARHLVNRCVTIKSSRTYYKKASGLVGKAGKALERLPEAVYTDFADIVDDRTMELYGRLSEAFDRLNVGVPDSVPPEYRAYLPPNDNFSYIRAGGFRVPTFMAGDDSESKVYLYPSLAIKYTAGTEFNMKTLADIHVSLTNVVHADEPTCILTIDYGDFELVTTEVDEATDFYNAFVALQDYLKEKKLRDEENDFNEESKRKDDEVRRSLDRLNALVGLEGVKKDFAEIADYIKIQQVRRFKGLKPSTVSHHQVFTGNPGTGKTTLARLLADIYKTLGILSSGHLVETDRSGLVAEYVGQTAVKTGKVIDSAIGGVLFIDEAYTLAGDKNDFGNEAIATLLKRMEDDRDKFVVVLAGYGDEMKRFIDSNPGLQSRFSRYIHFDDYSADELAEIFMRQTAESDYILTSDAEAKMRKVVREAVEGKDVNFGNARFVRNLFEKSGQRQAARLARNANLTKEELRTLLAADIPEK